MAVVELRVHGRVVETRPFTEMTVGIMEGLSKLDSSNEFYEMNKAILILKSCLVNKDDWEVFSDMPVAEFSEIVTEWTELQSGTTLD